MKHCPQCQSTYPDSLVVCPEDNSTLQLSGELAPGMVIRSKYEIQAHIGSGGMAEVYRAKHLAFNEVVAIKVVRGSYAADPSFNHRFKSEAVLARKLRHPNAIAIEDYDTTEDGRPYIVMELVDGRNLRQVIDAEGPLNEARALRLAGQVAAALAAAHQLGITHRDIKPDNIVITQDPRTGEIAKVLDFGIAKVKEGAFTAAAHTTTQLGMVVGTPQYMSPEQAMGTCGNSIDGRSDMYSLGLVIYEMLTGKLPFESNTPLGYCFHQVHSIPTPPREFATHLKIASATSKLVMKALEKDPSSRFSCMEEMMTALTEPESWAAAPPSPCVPTAGRRNELVSADGHRADQPQFNSRPVEAGVCSVTPIQRESLAAPIWRRRPVLAGLSVVAILAAIGVGIAVRFVPSTDQALHANIVERLRTIQSWGIRIDCGPCGGPTPYVNVSVDHNRAVTLSGRVARQSEADSIKQLLVGVAGVKEVVWSVVTVGEPANAVPVSSPSQVGGAQQGRAVQVKAKAAEQADANGKAAIGEPQANLQATASSLDEKPQPSPSRATQPAPHVRRALTEDEQRAQELVNLGRQQLSGGNYVSAINRFQLALELDPANSGAKAGLADAMKMKSADK